jgi:hypothetical protein
MDHLSTGHAGQRPDIGSFVRDALPGQDRTHPVGVSACPASVPLHRFVDGAEVAHQPFRRAVPLQAQAAPRTKSE